MCRVPSEDYLAHRHLLTEMIAFFADHFDLDRAQREELAERVEGLVLAAPEGLFGESETRPASLRTRLAAHVARLASEVVVGHDTETDAKNRRS